MSVQRSKHIRENLNYQNLFYLFMIANIFGVLLEGVWTVVKFGRWESHVITIWGPFCLLYGAGAILFYLVSILVEKKNIVIKFLMFALMSDLLEYFCAWLIDAGLGMKAWTYTKHMVHIKGRISLEMTVGWGFIGVLFFYLLLPKLDSLFQKIQGKFWSIACVVLTVFMVVNVAATTYCLIRWSKRHNGAVATNSIERFVDEKYDDAYMKKRFCEWWFIDEEKEFWQEYKKK